MSKVTIDRELLELSLNGDEQQQAKARNKLRTLLGGQGAEEHEAVEVVGYLNESGTYYPSMDSVERYAPPGEWLRRLMTVAQHERILAAWLRAQPALTVWEGAMPESNGKSNFTAVLMRKGGRLFDGLSGGMTIARSEYPDRVRYEADRVRYLIGELQEKPCILDYDTDKHSEYSAPAQPAADKDEVQRLREALTRLLSFAEQQVCTHEETHRGGAIWEICDMCGAKWADDEGGKPDFEWPAEIEAARGLLAAVGV